MSAIVMTYRSASRSASSASPMPVAAVTRSQTSGVRSPGAADRSSAPGRRKARATSTSQWCLETAFNIELPGGRNEGRPGSNLERERPCRHGWRPDAALLRVDDLRGARLAEQVPGQLRPLARGVDADPDGAVPEAVDVRVLLEEPRAHEPAGEVPERASREGTLERRQDRSGRDETDGAADQAGSDQPRTGRAERRADTPAELRPAVVLDVVPRVGLPRLAGLRVGEEHRDLLGRLEVVVDEAGDRVRRVLLVGEDPRDHVPFLGPSACHRDSSTSGSARARPGAPDSAPVGSGDAPRGRGASHHVASMQVPSYPPADDAEPTREEDGWSRAPWTGGTSCGARSAAPRRPASPPRHPRWRRQPKGRFRPPGRARPRPGRPGSGGPARPARSASPT